MRRCSTRAKRWTVTGCRGAAQLLSPLYFNRPREPPQASLQSTAQSSALLPESVGCRGRCVHIRVELSDLVFVLLHHHRALQLHRRACGENTAQVLNGDGTVWRHKSVLEQSKPGGRFRMHERSSSKLLFVINNVSVPSPVGRKSHPATATAEPRVSAAQLSSAGQKWEFIPPSPEL